MSMHTEPDWNEDAGLDGPDGSQGNDDKGSDDKGSDDKGKDDKGKDDKGKDDKGKDDKGKDDKDEDDKDEDDKDDKGGAERDAKGRFVKKGAGEEEEEEEEDEEEEEEEEEEDADKNKAQTVPLARFRKIVAERNAARERVAALERDTRAADNAADKAAKERSEKLDQLYEEVEELRADGKSKDAARVQRQIDALRQEEADAKAEQRARKIAVETALDTEYNRIAEYLEQARPVLDPNAPEFDQQFTDRFNWQVEAHIKGGMNPVRALREAAALLFTDDPFATRPRNNTADKGKDDKGKDDKGKDDKGKDDKGKKGVDVQKNLDAANRQPRRSDTSAPQGNDNEKLDISKLSDEDFDALPKSKLDELSGNNWRG